MSSKKHSFGIVKIKNKKKKQNLIETFGYNWFQASVNPFALIRLPSNGTSYMTKAHSAVNYNVDEAQTVIINDSTTSHRRRDFNTNTNII